MVRISLREALLLTAVVALAIASLKYASAAWLTIIATLATIAFFTAAIIPVVDRGKRQAFGIGFAIVVAIYGYLLINSSMGTKTEWNAEFGATRRAVQRYDGWVSKPPWNTT